MVVVVVVVVVVSASPAGQVVTDGHDVKCDESPACVTGGHGMECDDIQHCARRYELHVRWMGISAPRFSSGRWNRACLMWVRGTFGPNLRVPTNFMLLVRDTIFIFIYIDQMRDNSNFYKLANLSDEHSFPFLAYT